MRRVLFLTCFLSLGTVWAAVAPPGAFTLTAPTNGAVAVPLLPTLTWTASSGATTYTLEVATDAGFSTIVLSQTNIAATSYTPGAPVPQGVTFFWRVTAVSGGGNTLATGSPFSFTTLVLPPAPFLLLAPVDTATGVALAPTFSWAPSAGAATYTLEVATDAGFASVVMTQAALATTTFTPGTPLAANTLHYWRVTAVNGAGNVLATNAPFSFTTLSAGPGAFDLETPPDLSDFVSRNPYFNWSSSSGALSYTFELATDAAFASKVCTVTGLPGSSFGSSLTLAASTTYYWRVTAVNGVGSTGATSAPFSFQTAGSGGSSNSGNNGFSNSNGSCGLMGLEGLIPAALLLIFRRRRVL